MGTASQLVLRGFVLFCFGTIFSVVPNVLQIQRHIPSLQFAELTFEMLYSKWWVLLVCGSGSAFIGLIYPHFEHKDQNQRMRTQEWSRVLRCIAMFMGMNEACIKIDFPSNLQLSLSLAIMSIGLWWYFDRTWIGFGMGLSIALLSTFITQMLVYHEVYMYSEREFSYVRSWLPSVVFSGGITVGNIGKQLAANDFTDGKKHAE